MVIGRFMLAVITLGGVGSANSTPTADLHKTNNIDSEIGRSRLGGPAGYRPRGVVTGSSEAFIPEVQNVLENDDRGLREENGVGREQVVRGFNAERSKQGARHRTHDRADPTSGHTATSLAIVIVCGICAAAVLCVAWCWLSTLLICVSWCLCKFRKPDEDESEATKTGNGEDGHVVRATFCGTLASVVCASDGLSADQDTITLSQPCTPGSSSSVGDSQEVAKSAASGRGKFFHQGSGMANVAAPTSVSARAVKNASSSVPSLASNINGFRQYLTAIASPTSATISSPNCHGSCVVETCPTAIPGFGCDCHNDGAVPNGTGSGGSSREWYREESGRGEGRCRGIPCLATTEERTNEHNSTSDGVVFDPPPGVRALFSAWRGIYGGGITAGSAAARFWAGMTARGRPRTGENRPVAVRDRHNRNGAGVDDSSSSRTSTDISTSECLCRATSSLENRGRQPSPRCRGNMSGERRTITTGECDHSTSNIASTVYAIDNAFEADHAGRLESCSAMSARSETAQTCCSGADLAVATSVSHRHRGRRREGLLEREEKTPLDVEVEESHVASAPCLDCLNTGDSGVAALRRDRRVTNPLYSHEETKHDESDDKTERKEDEKRDEAKERPVATGDGATASPGLPRARALWRAFSEVDHDRIEEIHRRAAQRHLARFSMTPVFENPPMCYAPFEG